MDPPGRPVGTDDQQTLLQWGNEAPAQVLQTGIQAGPGGPRLEVGPVALTRVADYELIKEVGRGGMGVVFKARHVRLNRIVALKMIRGGTLADSDELQRFEKEASAAAQLQHPNIVALYEVSNYNQQPFLSMEFIGGTSLSERLSAGPLSCRRAASYLEATARAVHYAHSKGIIHRDLKPANVLLDDNDQPKVTDFGLAKQMEKGSDQTRTGAILGTPSYMSPEQAAGRKDIGPASDVYSLGAVLYELITGKPPFCGETPLATLNLVAEQDPLPPRVLNQAVDRDLETICLKCLEKSPARRYASAESLADDLRRYGHGEAISARRVSLIGRSIKWCRRNPAWTALSSFILIAVSVFMGFQWYVAFEEKELREQAEGANDLAKLRLETMRHLLYLSEMRQAQQTLRRADLEGVERILNGPWRGQEVQSDLRDWEWHFLKDQCRSRLAFGTHAGRAFAVSYRPDGKHIASAGGEPGKPGEIKVWIARNGKLLHTLSGHSDAVTSLVFHPEKNLLASASHDQTIKLWDLDDGREMMTLRGHTDSIHQVTFSPRGDRLASASADSTVRVWDWERYSADAPASMRVFNQHKATVTSVAFHPKENLLASGSRERSIKLWNLENGEVEKELKDPQTGHEGEIESIVFSPTGATLISGGGRGHQRGEICFWATDTGKLRQRRYGLSDRILSVSVSRDGKIAAAGADGILRIWNQETSSEPLTFRGDPQMIAGVAFAPDGFSLVTAGRSGRVSLWNSSGGLEVRTLAGPAQTESLALHPSGRFLATASPTDGDIRIWDLENTEKPLTIQGHQGGVRCLAFSSDGSHLASGGDDQTIRIVDFRARDKAPVILRGHAGRIHALAYSPDGLLIASAGEDESIRLHDPVSGDVVKVLTGHSNSVLCLAFSPDGHWLASGGHDKMVRLWDPKTGENTKTLEGHTRAINTLAFNPEDMTLASAGIDKTIRIWNFLDKKKTIILENSPTPIHSIAFHPRGRRLASVGQDRMLRLWDVVTRQEILEFDENVGAMRQVVFSTDGRDIAAAGNGIVRVWRGK